MECTYIIQHQLSSVKMFCPAVVWQDGTSPEVCPVLCVTAMALVRSALRLTRSSGVLVQATRAMADMPLTFAAPSQVFYNQQDVRQVDVPSFRLVNSL